MAINKWCIIFLAATVAALSTPATTKLFVVGDDKGWTLNFDYQVWAKDKVFVAGDQLVNGIVFQQCIIPPTNEALTSGYDFITLATPGRKWYMCGVGKHCEYGLKLFINVLPQSYPPPPPPPPPSVSPAPSGKVFVVGDDKGWTLNFDYQAWVM
ncbi:putative Phytocyanin domain, cupredoxin [Helianthus anomalus]